MYKRQELYKEIDTAKKYNAYKELPDYIPENLNPRMELREYQKAAFRNFVTYFETESLRSGTDRVLFHMATGSGKTLIMAGLMLYLLSLIHIPKVKVYVRQDRLFPLPGGKNFPGLP